MKGDEREWLPADARYYCNPHISWWEDMNASMVLLRLLVVEIIAAEEMRDGGELGTIPGRVIIELKERYGKDFHVLGYEKDLCSI